MRDTVKTEEHAPLIKGHMKLGGANRTYEVDVNSRYFTLNAKPWIPVMGEIHYSRVCCEDWERELRKMKAGGITAVSCYVIWIYHEEEEGCFDFTGSRDLRRFVMLCQKLGLWVVLRIGPWAHGEVRNGGFPDWLLKKDIKPRTNDPEYLSYVQRYYAKIYEQVQEFLFEKEGCIFAIQLENELTNNAPHLLKLKEMAVQCRLTAPIYTVTGWNSAYGAEIPEYDVVPVFGGYSEAPWDASLVRLVPSSNFFFLSARNDSSIGTDLIPKPLTDDGAFHMNYDLYPFATCEIGGGIQVTHHRRPRISPQEIYAIALVKLGSGNNLPGYYMYHGGTNAIGKLSTLQESKATGYPNDLPIRDYDFQAPLGRYGLPHGQYGKLKLMHLFLADFGSVLAGMDAYFPENPITDRYDTSSLRYSVRMDGQSGYVFVNNYQRLDVLASHEDVRFEIPLKEETLLFPEDGMKVPSGACFFLPFRLDLDGVMLQGATVQLICHKEDTWFFFAVDGIEGCYYLETGGMDRVEAAGCRRENVGGGLKLTPAVCGTDSTITVVKKDGKKIRLVTLTQEQAEHFYDLDGTVCVAGGEMFNTDEGQAVYRLGNHDLTGFKWDGNVFVPAGKSADERRPEVSFKECPGIDVQSFCMEELSLGGKREIRQWELSLKELSLTGLADVFLKISYVGDCIQIYINDTLAADEFYRGDPWLVSVRELLRFGTEVKILVSELRPEGVYLETEKNSGLAVESIEALPLYEMIW